MDFLESLSRGASWKAWAAVLLTGLTFAVGEVDKVLKVLAVIMFIDIASGLLSAIKRGKWNSKDGWRGLVVRKGGIFLLVMLAHWLDVIGNSNGLIRTGTACYLMANEGKSITENLTECGLNIPGLVTKALNLLLKKGDPAQEPSEGGPTG